jgi:protein-arginine kinase activator protein McsA
MARYAFAYDEPLTCRECGNDDFTFMKSIARLRCNNCKTSFSEQALVEEAVETMSDYIRHHGITERPPLALPKQSSDYKNTLAALLAALQVLNYPDLATEANWLRALRMVEAAVVQESRNQV